MDQGEDTVPLPEAAQCGEHEDQSKVQRKLPEPEPEPEPEADSDSSYRIHQNLEPKPEPEPSCVSLKSNKPKSLGIDFKSDQPSTADKVTQHRSSVPSDLPAQKHQTELDSIFMLLEENIVTFVKNELKRMQKVLSPDDPECSEGQKEDNDDLDGEDEEQRMSSREAFVNITLNFLKKMKQKELADYLHSKHYGSTCQHKLKSSLKKKFQCVFEGIAKAGSPALLNQIYTELYITEGGTGEVNQEHEVRQIETANRKNHKMETTIKLEDIFKVPPGRDQPIRTVMTKGVAGIGKTVLTQKFTLGFTDPQKEEYFRKRFKDEEQANRIISHIKTSKTLHIMCHIPVFCWMTATVLEEMLETNERAVLPKTLTEMYIHFLVVQTKVKKVNCRKET
ncbi:uncharacterized protein LOC106957801 [Poecilia latipinna]|uniref:uncharacterized protein LOC106957801 n=1 Tax=Poecilia latipinna TaxID=48699 RepID=UPI00072E07A1|nr:PREDICTED: uncharacterized protein LOC106957801 [Poecilia latipinna]